MSKLAIPIKILLLFVLSEMWFCYVGKLALSFQASCLGAAFTGWAITPISHFKMFF